jgi:hypothetical protein
MNQFIPKASHFFPWNTRIFFLKRIGNIFGRLSDDFKLPYHGTGRFIVGLELFKIHSFDKSFNSPESLQNISQI